MHGKHHGPKDKSDCLRKTSSVLHVLDLFDMCEEESCGSSEHANKTSLSVRLFQNPSACEAFHIHTYIQASQSETFHRERGFEKPSTGREVLKHTYKLSNQLSTVSMRFKSLLPVRVFAFNLSATQPKPWVFEFTPTRRLY